MIKLILGLVGSGKTLSVVKKIVDSEKLCFTNFNIRANNVLRLKKSHILTYERNEKGEKKISGINWDFWKKAVKEYQSFHIFLDEIQNILHSRSAMTKQNICMSKWVSQVRKITGENEDCDFVCISQDIMRVDVSVRDLVYEIIYCKKSYTSEEINTEIFVDNKLMKFKLPVTYILNVVFQGENCLERFFSWKYHNLKTYDKRSFFMGNPYFKYYDTYAIVDFEESEYI